MQSKLRVGNSLTGKKEVFEPLNPPFVGMYVCGPTVYSDVHLGMLAIAEQNMQSKGRLDAARAEVDLRQERQSLVRISKGRPVPYSWPSFV